MTLQGPDQLLGVGVLELRVLRVLPFQPHPDPRDPQADQLFDAVRLEHVGRAEHVKGPGLVAALHQFQQSQRPFAV